MLMANFGRQTKGIMVFLKMAHYYLREKARQSSSSSMLKKIPARQYSSSQMNAAIEVVENAFITQQK